MLAQSVRSFNLRRTESLPNSHVLFLRVRTPPCARPGGGDETGQPRPAFWADDFITGQTINVDGGVMRRQVKFVLCGFRRVFSQRRIALPHLTGSGQEKLGEQFPHFAASSTIWISSGVRP